MRELLACLDAPQAARRVRHIRAAGGASGNSQSRVALDSAKLQMDAAACGAAHGSCMSNDDEDDAEEEGEEEDGNGCPSAAGGSAFLAVRSAAAAAAAAGAELKAAMARAGRGS